VSKPASIVSKWWALLLAYVVGMKDTWALTTTPASGMRTHVWL